MKIVNIDDLGVIDEMEVIRMGLEEANEYGLEVEVVRWALQHMKYNSSLSIAEAMSLGVDEWIK